jgi:hypothetical protein
VTTRVTLTGSGVPPTASGDSTGRVTVGADRTAPVPGAD